jgi:hypothetical protein
VAFGNLGNSLLSPRILEYELKFLGTIFGQLGIIAMGRFLGRSVVGKIG